MPLVRPRYILYTGVFLGLTAFYGLWVWSSALGGFGDTAVYLLTAQYFHGGPGASLAGQFAASSPYPPLFALTLAAFGGANNLLAAHVITAVTLVLSCAVFLFWLRTLGLSPVMATLYMLVFALSPGLEMQALEILSEPLYLLFSLTALAAASRTEKTQDYHWVWLCSVATALALLTRTAGVALWAAFMLWLILRRPRREWLLGVASLFPFLVWQGWHLAGTYAYLAPLQGGHLAPGGHGLLAALRTWLLAWSTDVTGSIFKPPFLLTAAVVAILGLAGSVRRLPAMDALYVLMYMTMILLWPFPAEASRLLIVILPVLLATAAQCLMPIQPAGAAIRAGLALALLILVLPQTAFNLLRLGIPETAALSPYKHFNVWYTPDPKNAVFGMQWAAAVTGLLKSLPALVPPGECILSIKPALTALYSHRASYSPPAGSVPDRAFWAELRAQHCRYDLVLDAGSPAFPGRFYPLSRLLPVLRKRLTVVRAAPLSGIPGAPLAAVLIRLPPWPPTGPVPPPTPAKS